MTSLRQGVREDVDPVVALEQAVFGRVAWSRSAVAAEFATSDESRCAVVATDGALLVGYGIMSVAGDTADVRRLAVHPAHRRQGIARLLMERLLELCAEPAASRVLLEVAADNAGARAFYADQGFAEIARRLRYYDARVDAVVMERYFRL